MAPAPAVALKGPQRGAPMRQCQTPARFIVVVVVVSVLGVAVSALGAILEG